MRMFKRAVIAVVVIIFLAIIAFMSVFIYEIKFKKIEIYREYSPDHAYEFVLYQVGSPEWPFGPCKAEIKVVDPKGKTADRESILIHNDGAQVSEYNIKSVRWYDSKLELECTGTTEHSIATYILEFE